MNEGRFCDSCGKRSLEFIIQPCCYSAICKWCIESCEKDYKRNFIYYNCPSCLTTIWQKINKMVIIPPFYGKTFERLWQDGRFCFLERVSIREEIDKKRRESKKKQ